MSRTLTPMTVGCFRVLHQPTFDELEPLQRIARRHDGQSRSYMQWLGLLHAERARTA